MPKIGELWVTKGIERIIIKVTNFSSGVKNSSFLHYQLYNPSTGEVFGNEQVMRMPRNWNQEWERYVSSGSGSGSSSVSTPNKKTSESEDIPNTVKRPPHREPLLPPLPLTSRPQYKDGGVDEDLQAINENLSKPNGRWILRRNYDANNNAIEIGQEVVVIGQRRNRGHPSGHPIMIHCLYKTFNNGQLGEAKRWILKEYFIDGTFEFRSWSLTDRSDPPNPPSYEAAQWERGLREGFGFFKNNINIKF